MIINGFIDLRIGGQGLNLNEITQTLSIRPDHAYKKGDMVFSKITKTETVHKEDSWIAGVKVEEGGSLEKATVRFLEKLRPNSDYLKMLASSFDVILWLSLYPDNEQMNVHLSPSIIAQVYEMGISIDVEAAFLKQIYEGNY